MIGVMPYSAIDFFIYEVSYCFHSSITCDVHKMLLNKVCIGHKPVDTWHLQITFVSTSSGVFVHLYVFVCICVCVCVCLCGYICE